MAKTYKPAKRLISLVLALITALGVCGAGVPGIIASATVTTASAMPSFTFYVPETIYLDPTDNKNFKYFINREQEVGGDLHTSQDTSGLIYFNCPGATAVTSLMCFDANVNLSATSSTNGILMSTINSGDLHTAIGISQTKLITWALTFQYSGKTHTVNAYTVAYAPNRNVTANGITGFDYNSSEAFSSSLIWIQGAQVTNTASVSYQDGSSDHRINYQHATSGLLLDPLVNGVSNPDDNNPHDYGSTSSGEFNNATASFSSCYCVRKDDYDGDGQWVIHVDCNRTPAEIIADSSRYTNTNQIPNLKLAFMVTDWAASNKRRNWYVSDATSAVSNPNNLSSATLIHTGKYGSSNSSVDLLKHSRWRKDDFSKAIYERYYGTVLRDSAGRTAPSCGDDHPGSNIDGHGDDIGKKYLEPIDYALSGGSCIRYFRGASCGARDSSWAMSTVLVILKITVVNKGTLRDLVNTCIGTYVQDYYTVSSWSTYSTALENAARVLGNPSASASEISTAESNLTSAKNSLVLATGTAKIFHMSTSGITLGTEQKSYTYGQNVTAAPNTYNGYDYTSVSPNILTYYDVMDTPIIWQMYYTPINYTIGYNLNGGSASGNPSSYTIESDDITLSNPTRTGYAFRGWSGTGLTGDSNTEVTISNGSTGNRNYTANWIANAYSVSFSGNGATGGSMSNQPFYYGTAQNLTPNAFVRQYTVTYKNNNGSPDTTDTANYSFARWTHGSTVYSDGQSVNNLCSTAGDVYALTAQWTPGSVTLPTPTYANHIFAGWFTDSALTEPVTGTTFTPTQNTTLYAKWERPAKNDAFVIDTGLPVDFNVLENDLSGASLVSVASGGGFTTTVNGTAVRFTPETILTVPVTFDYTASYGSGTYTATVTVLPATSVYYEESFITFSEGDWSPAGTAAADAFSTIDSAYGFDSAYNDAGNAIYSLGRAMKSHVSKDNTKGPSARFTFSGTGFEIYSLTSSETGLVVMEIYSGTVTENVDPVARTMINTYLGNAYGQLYLTADNTVTLTATGNKPIYYADDSSEETFFIDGPRKGTLTPTYKDGEPDYAYGWVQEGGNSGIYQTPVLEKSGLGYGTYTVVLKPMFSSIFSPSGVTEYDFYIDSVRVFNPLPADDTASADIYKAAGEYNPGYLKIRDALISAETFGEVGSGKIAGVAFLENGRDITVQDYKEVGPKGEVYLNPGQAIAFTLTTENTVQPAKITLGARTIKGSAGKVQIICNGATVPLTLNGSTELYRDITAAVKWKTSAGENYVSYPIIICNSSNYNQVVSLSKIKYSYNTEAAGSSPDNLNLSFSFSGTDLLACSAAFAAVENSALVADSTGVTAQWNKTQLVTGETAVLTVKANENFGKAFVDGHEIAGYTEQNGERIWTYTFSPSEAGTFAFDITLTDINGCSTAPISTSLSASAAENTDNPDSDGEPRVNSLFFIKIFKTILNLFARIAENFRKAVILK